MKTILVVDDELKITRLLRDYLQQAGFRVVTAGDGLAALPAGLCFDLLVANPPYIPSGEIDALSPEVRDFDPRMALDGGADGLAFYRRLAEEAPPFLNADGKLFLEFGDGQAEALRRLFEGQNWVVEAVDADYSDQPRILRVRPGR